MNKRQTERELQEKLDNNVYSTQLTMRNTGFLDKYDAKLHPHRLLMCIHESRSRSWRHLYETLISLLFLHIFCHYLVVAALLRIANDTSEAIFLYSLQITEHLRQILLCSTSGFFQKNPLSLKSKLVPIHFQ